ncbi:hypothetical protein G2W53_034223 [Senna tora]|uniref:Uncharacterized protein n=1 Tax=Senna tora TaxID=362788 RepID=A0A834W8Q2_9FABA|nr:hypothetical protein G2W53_034223 [Senna tora]
MRHSHEIEASQVNIRTRFRPRRAPQDPAPGGLRAIPELTQPYDRQNHRSQPRDLFIRSKHGGPDIPHHHGKHKSREPQEEAETESHNGRELRLGWTLSSNLVSHSRGDAEAYGGWENVEKRGGLDQNPHGSHGGFGICEQPTEQNHDLVPPPFEANRDAAWDREFNQRLPLCEALESEATPCFLVGAREDHVENQGCDENRQSRTECERQSNGLGSEKDLLHVEPKQRDGYGGEEEEEDGSLQAESKKGEFLGSEGLSTDGFHADGEAGEDRVAGNVGESDGQGAAGEGELAEAAEEEHGDHGAAIEKETSEDHRESYVGDGDEFMEGLGEMVVGALF